MNTYLIAEKRYHDNIFATAYCHTLTSKYFLIYHNSSCMLKENTICKVIAWALFSWGLCNSMYYVIPFYYNVHINKVNKK